MPDNVLMMTSSGAASNDLRPRNMADAVIGSSRASNMPIFGRTEEQSMFCFFLFFFFLLCLCQSNQSLADI